MLRHVGSIHKDISVFSLGCVRESDELLTDLCLMNHVLLRRHDLAPQFVGHIGAYFLPVHSDERLFLKQCQSRPISQNNCSILFKTDYWTWIHVWKTSHFGDLSCSFGELFFCSATFCGVRAINEHVSRFCYGSVGENDEPIPDGCFMIDVLL